MCRYNRPLDIVGLYTPTPPYSIARITRDHCMHQVKELLLGNDCSTNKTASKPSATGPPSEPGLFVSDMMTMFRHALLSAVIKTPTYSSDEQTWTLRNKLFLIAPKKIWNGTKEEFNGKKRAVVLVWCSSLPV